jgi:hypothetical protein
MLALFFRAAAVIVNDIIADEPNMLLPLYFPKSPVLFDSPLEEVVIIGNDYCVMPRRSSFFENTNGAKAPHSPR